MNPLRLPTQLHCRAGSRHDAAPLLRDAGLRTVLLVVDPGLAETGWRDEIQSAIASAGMHAAVFDRIEPNPRTTTAEAAAALLREVGADGVVALGGGSALDTAKAAAMLAVNSGPAAGFAGAERFATPALPVMALPTTCGTGSEVTWVAVLSDPDAGAKISIKGASMYPRWALVDPDLLATLPPHLVAWTGMDALTHAVEAATCRPATPFSVALAAAATRRLLASLPRAHRDVAGDAQAREAMAWASTLAGVAFGNADVAAVHCLSESIGGLLDVPHGLANACLLGPVLEALSPEIDPALSELADAAGVAGGARGFVRRVRDLTGVLGVPALSSLGVGAVHVDRVAALAATNGSNASNVRTLTADDYRGWLERWLA